MVRMKKETIVNDYLFSSVYISIFFEKYNAHHTVLEIIVVGKHRKLMIIVMIMITTHILCKKLLSRLTAAQHLTCGKEEYCKICGDET